MTTSLRRRGDVEKFLVSPQNVERRDLMSPNLSLKMCLRQSHHFVVKSFKRFQALLAFVSFETLMELVSDRRRFLVDANVDIVISQKKHLRQNVLLHLRVLRQRNLLRICVAEPFGNESSRTICVSFEVLDYRFHFSITVNGQGLSFVSKKNKTLTCVLNTWTCCTTPPSTTIFSPDGDSPCIWEHVRHETCDKFYKDVNRS